MSIFVLAIFKANEGGYSETTIVGAFSSLEKAQAAAAEGLTFGQRHWTAYPKNQVHGRVPMWTTYRYFHSQWLIQEHEVA